MKVKVNGRQPNAKMCFVCGLENKFGLKSRFYDLANGEIMAVFSPAEEHQGYPGRLHGGIAASILDETMGRAVMKQDSPADIWGVTVDFSMKLRQPVPLDAEVRVVARVTKEKKRTFEGQGEILLSDGSVAVEGHGRYLKLDLSAITDAEFKDENWKVNDPQEIPSELDY